MLTGREPIRRSWRHSLQMRLIRRIARLRLARISNWAAELAPFGAVGLYELLERYPLVESILAGIVEASPYLFDLIRADGARFLNLLRSEPQAHLSDLIDALRAAVVHAPDEPEVMTLLRTPESRGGFSHRVV